jgi:hypothetical protein
MGVCNSKSIDVFSEIESELKYITKHKRRDVSENSFNGNYLYFLYLYDNELKSNNHNNILENNKNVYIIYFYLWLYCKGKNIETNIVNLTINRFENYSQLYRTHLQNNEYSMNVSLLKNYIEFVNQCKFEYSWLYNNDEGCLHSVTK